MDLIKNRRWIEMVRRGVSFFVLEKMAAVIGVSNPEVYAAFRGETLEEFMATRKVSIKYSVAGGHKALEMDAHWSDPGLEYLTKKVRTTRTAPVLNNP